MCPAPHSDLPSSLHTAHRIVELHPPTLRRLDVESRSGVDPERARAWWRAMGFPEVDDAETVFSDDDLAMVVALRDLVDEGAVDDDDVLRLARLMGASFSRLVDAQLDTVEHMLAAAFPETPPHHRWERLAELSPDGGDVLDFLEQAMVYVWRRHLLAELGQRLEVSDATAEETIGFADLTGFSRVSKELSGADLAAIIDTFEAVAFDVINTHEARVVKLIGDEVMFVADDVDAAVAVCLELIERLQEIEIMPPVHCGIAPGPTITVGGDVFGPAVNLASRLTGVARPGTVAVPRDAGRHLLERDDLDVRRVRRIYDLKGVGRTSILAVRPRPAVEAPQPTG